MRYYKCMNCGEHWSSKKKIISCEDCDKQYLVELDFSDLTLISRAEEYEGDFNAAYAKQLEQRALIEEAFND